MDQSVDIQAPPAVGLAELAMGPVMSSATRSALAKLDVDASRLLN